LPRKRKDNRIVFGSLTRERDMSILDDAIREHLELKRAHGADDVELKKLEDEAFGPPARPEEPDPFAEAPTEFLTAAEDEGGDEADEEPRAQRSASLADLQEAPGQAPPPPEPEPEPEIDGGHSTEERHAIAEQPTEHFDVQGQFEDAATEADAPSDDELVDAELAEPRLAPVDPLAGIEAHAAAEPEAAAEPAPAAEEEEAEDEFEEFFSEQRLSDELNQALEAPLPDEPGAPITDESTAIYEVEEAAVEGDVEDGQVEEISDELPLPDETSAEHRLPDETEEHELPEEISDEHEIAAPEQRYAHEADEDDDEHGEDDDPATPAPPSSHEDVLEDTPDFLEDAPEDDNLWFEQKPPKDFDFDD
jgi:hypothetical protein